MKTRLFFNLFPAKSRASAAAAAKRSLYVIAAAGAATFTLRSLNGDNQVFLPTSSYHATDFPRLYAVVRCSRAMFTVLFVSLNLQFVYLL